MEVLECHEPNNGRDPFPALLRRSPLPKVCVVMAGVVYNDVHKDVQYVCMVVCMLL